MSDFEALAYEGQACREAACGWLSGRSASSTSDSAGFGGGQERSALAERLSSSREVHGFFVACRLPAAGRNLPDKDLRGRSTPSDGRGNLQNRQAGLSRGIDALLERLTLHLARHGASSRLQAATRN